MFGLLTRDMSLGESDVRVARQLGECIRLAPAAVVGPQKLAADPRTADRRKSLARLWRSLPWLLGWQPDYGDPFGVEATKIP